MADSPADVVIGNKNAHRRLCRAFRQTFGGTEDGRLVLEYLRNYTGALKAVFDPSWNARRAAFQDGKRAVWIKIDALLNDPEGTLPADDSPAVTVKKE